MGPIPHRLVKDRNPCPSPCVTPTSTPTSTNCDNTKDRILDCEDTQPVGTSPESVLDIQREWNEEGNATEEGAPWGEMSPEELDSWMNVDIIAVDPEDKDEFSEVVYGTSAPVTVQAC